VAAFAPARCFTRELEVSHGRHRLRSQNGPLPPYSVTLPGGEIAAAWENSPMIARPFEVVHRAKTRVATGTLETA
jgi:hypothetical protein